MSCRYCETRYQRGLLVKKLGPEFPVWYCPACGCPLQISAFISDMSEAVNKEFNGLCPIPTISPEEYLAKPLSMEEYLAGVDISREKELFGLGDDGT